MENTKKNKNLYRRYVDDLYTTEDARQLLDSLPNSDDHEILNELSSDIWEEAATQQPLTDLEREHYKREARQLLKRIEHKKRTWFRRIAVVAVSTAAIVCLALGGMHYLKHLNERQIIYMEAATSYGERKQILLPDGTQLTLNSCSHVRYPNNFIGEERKIELEGEGYFQVHRNEEQPFIVSTRRFDVRVLGTCFDIKSYSSDEVVSVEVESGKVQVDLPEAMMRLKGKEQVLINTISGEYSKRREDRPVAIWKKWRSGLSRFWGAQPCRKAVFRHYGNHGRGRISKPGRLDFVGKKPGRGAYVCYSVECLKKARKSRALERALEISIPAEVYDAMEAELEGRDGQE